MVKARVHLLWQAAIAALLFLIPSAREALSQPGVGIRQVIASCWQHGAINEFMMLQCTGLNVPPPVFMSCMSGGPCFGEPGNVPAGAGGGAPLCGAAGLPFCPRPSPCGFVDTIACPPPPGSAFPPFPVAQGCGALPFPPCIAAQQCGRPTTFRCGGPDGPMLAGLGSFNSWQPTLQVALPGSGQVPPGQNVGGIRFAEPIVPSLSALKRCRSEAQNEDEFMSCMVDRAFPPAYKMTRDCLDKHPDDAGAAFVCSTGNKNLEATYNHVREVQECASQASDKVELANCVGQQGLGSNERYYANCVVTNRDSVAAAAVCGLSKDLTPEQQIALSCAMTSGGQPYAFATCAGGRLTAREIGKCWDHGIATDEGCFGPNNEIRKYWNSVDGTLRTAIGENNEFYKAFVLYKDNVLMPGPNHELVRAANTAIGDIRNGPGPNNDIVKAGQAVSGGLQSVAQAVGNAINIHF